MNSRATPSVFGLVWRGWFAGVLVIFVPLWLVATVILAIGGKWGELLPALGGLVALPVIAAGQGLIAGGLVALGLNVWPPKTSK